MTDKDSTPRHVRVGQAVRQRREQLGLSQRALVEALRSAGLVTSISSIQRLEKGTYLSPFANPAFVRELARLLDMPSDELLALAGMLDESTPSRSAAMRMILRLYEELPSDEQGVFTETARALVTELRRLQSKNNQETK